MDERSSGIILRVRPFTETSLVVHWLTRDMGRLSTVAKGARRSKSSFLGKLDLFFDADFSYQRSRRSDLHILKEVGLRNTHSKLRQELAWLHQASYFAVLIESATEQETPIEEIYCLMRDALGTLPTSVAHSKFIFAFELKLLRLLGVEPELNQSPLPEAARNDVRNLIELDWAQIGSVEIRHCDQLSRFLRVQIGATLERLPLQRERALQSIPAL